MNKENEELMNEFSRVQSWNGWPGNSGLTEGVKKLMSINAATEATVRDRQIVDLRNRLAKVVEMEAAQDAVKLDLKNEKLAHIQTKATAFEMIYANEKNRI